MAYSRYYRSALAPGERPLYDALAEGLSRIEGEIPVPCAPQLNPSRYTTAVELDYPEFFYVDFSRIRFIISQKNSRVLAAYHADKSEICAQRSAIERRASELLKGCAGKTPLEIELQLHDILVSTCTYGSFPERAYDAHSIFGALMDHRCVCEGFAKAFKYLADLAKLQCLVVHGDAAPPGQEPGGHAWNMVNLGGGNIYHLDVTFDQLIDQRYGSKAYFNLSDREISYDHTPWTSMFRVPAAPKSGAVLSTVGGTAQLLDYLRGEYARGACYCEVMLTKGFPSEKLIQMIVQRLQPSDYAWFNAIKRLYYGSGSRSLFVLWK